MSLNSFTLSPIIYYFVLTQSVKIWFFRLCVLAILAATTGIFIAHKKMLALDNHAFEGELVEMYAIPMGSVIENPEYSDVMVSPAWRDRFDGGGGFGSDANDVTIGSDASGRC